MKFGVSGCAGGFEAKDAGDVLALAELAEQLRYDGIWIYEEHFRHQDGLRRCLSPITLATAIAGRTKRIRVGFSALLLPLYIPLRLAEEIATLDVLSDGRVDFGISKGRSPRYYEAYGVEVDVPAGAFREELRFIVKCWADGETTIRGKKYAVEPKPVQRPHPPVYIATYTPGTARWAARSEHAIIQHGIQSRESLKRMIGAFESAGGDPGRVPVNRFVYVGRDDRSARRAVWPVICRLAQFLHGIGIYRHGIVPEKTLLDPDTFYEEMLVAGGPRTCVEKLRELRGDLGVDYVNCLASFYGYERPGAMVRSLRTLSADVMPAMA